MQLTLGANRTAGWSAAAYGIVWTAAVTYLTWATADPSAKWRGNDRPGGLFVALFWLPVIGCAFIACWGLWGREVITVRNGALARERRLFGWRLSRSEFKVTDIRGIWYSPSPKRAAWASVYPWFLPQGWGAWLGDVAFEYRGATVRIAEGLDSSGINGEDLVRQLSGALDIERDLV